MSAAIVQTPTARHNVHGIVFVLDCVGSLSYIRKEGAPEGEEFWVKSVTLKAPQIKPVHFPAPHPAAALIIYDGDEWGRLARHLMETGDYKLLVFATQEGAVKAAGEYLWWCGDTIPDTAIYYYENRNSPREWRLTFPFDPSVAYPFPIDEMGTSNHVGPRKCDRPRGLLRSKGHRNVEVNFACIVETLVRAGLRIIP